MVFKEITITLLVEYELDYNYINLQDTRQYGSWSDCYAAQVDGSKS